jgi:prolyl oligopeptidase
MLRLSIHVPLSQRRVFGLLTRSVSSRTMSPTPWIPDKYPVARRSDHVDVYKSTAKGEVRVPDPYQWMEEYSDELEKWTSAQHTFSRSYLDQNTDRQKLEAAFRATMDYAKVNCVRIHLSYLVLHVHPSSLHLP